MRPVDRSDKAVGRVVKAFGIDGSWRGRYRLRMPDMTESDRSYSASELVETFFDPKVDLKGRDLLPAPGSLIGCSVHVWFLPDADSTQGGAYWPGVLKRVDKGWSPPTGGLAGWFFCHYEDSIEPLFIGLRADGTSTYAACAPCDANHLHSHLHDVCNAKANVRIAHGDRDDGECMPGGQGGEIIISEARLAAAVDALAHPPSSSKGMSVAASPHPSSLPHRDDPLGSPPAQQERSGYPLAAPPLTPPLAPPGTPLAPGPHTAHTQRWQPDEEEQLRRLMGAHAGTPNADKWRAIAAALRTGRSAGAVEQHWDVVSGKRNRAGALVPPKGGTPSGSAHSARLAGSSEACRSQASTTAESGSSDPMRQQKPTAAQPASAPSIAGSQLSSVQLAH
eukprot:6210035-Prymnesium_polylepis.1